MANKAGNQRVHEVDVVVVGAGLIGLAAVIALHAEGKRVALIDARDSKVKRQASTWDTRVYAITPATRCWLQGLGVWPLVDHVRVNDVEAMSLWNEVATDALDLKAEDANLPNLACIVEDNNLMQALWQKVETLDALVLMGSELHGMTHSADAVELRLAGGSKVSATLLIAADGAHSFVRQTLGVTTKDKAFEQTALVANYLAEKGHSNIARQWFAPHSTLALLPLPKQHVSMVWSVPTALSEELLGLSEQALAIRVEAISNEVLGGLKPISATLSFPLRQSTANALIADRVVFVGDAAHQVHPMAGQGANLGFRDIMALQAIIAGSHTLQDIGEKGFLRQYERSRKADILSMNTLISGLDYLFAKDSTVMKSMVEWGMGEVNKHPIIKNILIKQAVA